MESWTNRDRLARLAIVLLSVFAAIAAQWQGNGALEDGAQALVMQAHERQASGQVHVVEMDAKSLRALNAWPWPREYHAQLVEALDKAGARSVVFDIEFASYSSEGSDRAFANSIAQSKTPVYLATFSQKASAQSEERVDSLPIPQLRENASLVSAGVYADRDALVRKMFFGTMTDGLPRPSMSAQIAGYSGGADESFVIDYSVDPATVPHHSFVDILEGEFEPGSIKGKDVLVGATAVELGDRYGVPIHGVIPGVLIQALSAETLLTGQIKEAGWVYALLLASIFAILIVNAHRYDKVGAIALLGVACIIVLQVIAYHFLRVQFTVVPGLLAILFAGFAQCLRIARVQLRERTLRDAETGMPNALAFARADHSDEQFVATAFVHDFDSIQSVLGKAEMRKFFDRLTERFETKASVSELYRADTRIIAWKHADDYKALTDAFERLAEAFKKPVEIAGRRIDVSLSFGIASGANIADASRASSQAAKESRLWHAHEDAEAAIVEQRVTLMGELDEAVEHNQLTVLYQPKLRIETDRIESVEALVRWHHPERGFMRPDLFIPLAEETNRIEALTLFVLRKTIEDLTVWKADGVDISAAVNISANLISSESFVATVEEILRQKKDRHSLIFEVTESATMRDPELAAANLRRFRELGVLISMDDYGTGQSTLSYIQMLPLSELKIDRAFVQNAHIKRSDELLVRSTIQLAHSLGLRVVGEGIEEQACLDFLREAGCDYAQGYYIAKPLSFADLMAKVGGQLPATADT